MKSLDRLTPPSSISVAEPAGILLTEPLPRVLTSRVAMNARLLVVADMQARSRAIVSQARNARIVTVSGRGART